MNYPTTRVNIKYQVVIPKEIRNVVSVEPNELVAIFSVDKNTIMLKKVPKSIRDLRGSYKFSNDYLAKERLSW